MKSAIKGNVSIALTLWLILALSNVSGSQGFSFGCFFFWCPNPSPSPRHPPRSSPTTPNPPPPSTPTTPTTPNPPPPPSIPTTPTTPSPTRPAGLTVGFYKGLCPNNVDIEATLRAKVQEEFKKDPSILPAFLRMQFHDCFVHGCDASILIKGAKSEQTAGANLSVRGYDLIDLLKSIAESLCPGMVSCADLIALTTNEVLKQGGGPDFPLQTGREDGLQSNANDVDLPGPTISVGQAISVFGAKNFSPEEMVVLLGAHTVGISHCAFFEDRLYQDKNDFDPNMDPNLRRQLSQTCPESASSNNFANLDQNPPSSNIVDNSYYDQILKQRGILPIDQALARDLSTQGFVTQFAQSPSSFNSKLASAMAKLQALDVLTGGQGEIRKTCSKFN